MRSMRDFHDLRLTLFGYPVGSWFLINDGLINWKKRVPRPFVLPRDYSGGPTVVSYARTTTASRGRPHRAHPRKHTPRCEIDRDGWIVETRVTLDAECLRNTYMCEEPDNDTLVWLSLVR
jgi:hypothetical protein